MDLPITSVELSRVVNLSRVRLAVRLARERNIKLSRNTKRFGGNRRGTVVRSEFVERARANVRAKESAKERVSATVPLAHRRANSIQQKYDQRLQVIMKRADQSQRRMPPAIAGEPMSWSFCPRLPVLYGSLLLSHPHTPPCHVRHTRQ